MRQFVEPSAKNLLRKPLVLGVPLFGLLPLAFVVLAIELLAGGTRVGDVTALGIGFLGFIALRVLSRFAKSGWEESMVFPVERMLRKLGKPPTLSVRPSEIRIVSPDTLDQADFLAEKESVLERITSLRSGEFLRLWLSMDRLGASLHEYSFDGLIPKKVDLQSLWPQVFARKHVYSLHQLPVTTDPIWLFGTLSRLSKSADVFLSVQGLDFNQAKKTVELARKSNARDNQRISNIDSEVSFSEASKVLEGLSRGEERLVELSLVIASDEELDLDPEHFIVEKNPELTFLSVTGLRRRLQRSFLARAVTGADLVPSVLDPKEEGLSICHTVRKSALYFSPADSRLEALHWLVVGASGSGKSFFTGLVLRRLIESGSPMSVLFVDHNRSFRRSVLSSGSRYFEPVNLAEVQKGVQSLLLGLNRAGATVGIELSDLALAEKKEAAYLLLSSVENFLRTRDSLHPVYLVLDECWNFLRDEPVLVQRAFREFRKLNGAVVAITQSLSDFLRDESGTSILQNAPIRILLRQGEDLTPFRGALGLNDTELARVRMLKQVRGEYSECLIKTPFLSRVGRLYPTEVEHRLLRTDNLREERVDEIRRMREKEGPCLVGG